ncbi:hypothetical protein ASG92_00805 [Arthrobacter sp. Soil736]|uniref:hypothetical protein n=1 Tax=Arthrobacter sp. Soil736 TaxID=1736395 RepID=UPI00070202E2|nr:hypothetical protein [Arthrobacter sp. Soil736]KRE68449.1 hypothetical protein ASG92_00805 [Arthrobacter sp. Soil736]
MAESTPSGSGGPLRPVEPAPGPFLSVRGGVGGIAFQLQELAAGAIELDGLARDLASVELDAHRVWTELGPYQNDPPSSGTEAVTAVWEARRAVAAVREELQDIVSQVQACQRDYEAAEQRSLAGLRSGADALRLLPAQLMDLHLGGLGEPLRADFSRLLNRDTMEEVTGNYPVILGLLALNSRTAAGAATVAAATGMKGAGVPDVIRMLAGGVMPQLRPRPVTATATSTAEITLDASPAGLLARAEAVDEDGRGKIEVIRTEHGGRAAFVVIVPGTQPGDAGGSNPFDEHGIAEGLGYGSEHTSAAIREALRQAGAEAGAQVVAVGYSQGGIHAMNLSRDKAFLAEYDLKYVLTAGSPVGGINPEPGISSLHLEHRQDWVPGADGVPSPDTRDRVTVTLHNRVLTPMGEGAGLGPGHRLANYEAGARAVSASGDPSLVASTAALAGVVGAGGAATATRFQLVRTPKPPEPGRPDVAARRAEQSDVRPAGGR